MFYPDTLVGTDSHTTMINGIGVVGTSNPGVLLAAGLLAKKAVERGLTVPGNPAAHRRRDPHAGHGRLRPDPCLVAGQS